MTAEVIDATNREKAQLQGRANVVESGGGARIYVRGELVDTIHRNDDGTTTHVFANGHTVTVLGPALGTGRHRATLKQNQPANICGDLAALISADQSKLNWDSAAVILAVGASAAAAFFTAGTLTPVGGVVTGGVFMAWVAQKNALDNAENSYASAGC